MMRMNDWCLSDLKACGGAEGMAGFPQALDPLWTSRIGEDDDPYLHAPSYAQSRAGQPQLLELNGPQPDPAGNIEWAVICAARATCTGSSCPV